MNKNRRIPGFTAENALEQQASTRYTGLAQNRAGGDAVEPSYIIQVPPKPYCPLRWTYGGTRWYTSKAACLADPNSGGDCYQDYMCNQSCWCP
jgi:hypothetical protein